MDYLDTQGIRLPKLGLGTFKLEGDICRSSLESALELGYRHIDTATMYDNEAEIGATLTEAGLPRHELHITTKVWHDQLAPAAIQRALATSLKKLRLDYVDLFLVHWPSPDMDLPAIFETLLRLREQGLVRAVGVCNFTVPLLRSVIEQIGAPIACNQIEYHLLLDQTPVRAYLASHGVPVVAYCPLAQGKLADHPDLARIAAKHGAQPAQVALKWLLDQEGVAAIPKARRKESQQANLDALHLQLDDEDRRLIAALPKNQRLVNPGFGPTWDLA
ncbi:aldo/keto reductase [Chitinimonas naiadis]